LQRAEVLGAGARLNLNVAQLPFVAGERWVGLPPVPGAAMPPSKLSLVLHTVAAINASQAMTGLLVDEWVETVPNSRETTALVYEASQRPPRIRARKEATLFECCGCGPSWEDSGVLMETFYLAKLRSVDTVLLGGAAQYLPGLYFAFNTCDHAVSTDFKPLTA
jgi:hypothetical protein